MKTITKPQLCVLSGIARQAWIAAGKPGYEKGTVTVKAAFDSFRKSELALVTKDSNHATSWTDVLNDDFEAIEAHFLNLAGRYGEAFNAHIHEQTKKLRQMRVRIAELLREAALATGDAKKWSARYAEAISRSEYKKPSAELASKELRQLLITISQRTRRAIKAALPESEEAAQFASADRECGAHTAQH